MKIRTKTNLSFIITAVISFLILGYLISFYFLKENKSTIYSYLYSSGRARAEHVITFIKDQKTTSNILAAASVYRDLLKEPIGSSAYAGIKKKIDDRLIRTLQTDKNIYEAFIIDKNGKIVASSNKTEEGEDKSQDDYFTKAKGGVYFKDVYFSTTINKLNYTISSPITDSDGTFLGVSVLRYPPSLLYSITTNENGLGNTEENFLINHDKFLLTPTNFLDESNVLKTKVDTKNANDCFDPIEVDYINKNGYSGLKNIASHKEAVEDKDYRNVEVIATHTYIPEQNWCLITKVDKADVLKVGNSLIINLWIYIIISSIIFIGIILLFINKIIKAILNFIKATKIYNRGEENYRIEVKTKDEIGELGESFNNMANAVSKSKNEIENKVEEQTKDIREKTQELDNQKTAILNILEDVKNEKNKSEEILKRFNLATEAAKIGVWEWDVINNILIWDDQMYNLYGINKKDFGGAYDAWQKGLHPEDRESGDIAIKKALSGEKDFTPIFRVIWPSGEVRYIQAYALVERDEFKKPLKMVGVNFDITHEKEVDKVKSEFVSLASHQLRTPLSAINWYTEMLLDEDAGAVNEEQKKYLQEVYTSSQRMVELVNSLLNVSRLDLGTFIIEPKPTDLSALVKSVLLELKSQIDIKELTVTDSYDNNLPLFNADQNLIRMTIQNLLSNAVKYTSKKGSVSMKINNYKTGLEFGGKKFSEDRVGIMVSDSGMGIPNNEKEKIFSKLFRAENARQSETEGTGLGLYIIKSIIDQSGGEVWFNSEEGKGTTFYISFPISGMKKKEGFKNLD